MFKQKLGEITNKLKKERTKSEILVERHDSLQDEHLKLANKLLNTKDKLTDTQYDLLSSLDKIAKQRYVNFEASQELSAALEQIRILEEKIQKSNNMNEGDKLRKLNEDLNFKTEVVDCLEKELTEKRLKLAEQDALVKELRDELGRHEKDVNFFKEQKLAGVAEWQTELMEANQRVQKILKEFESLRNDLLKIKIGLVDHLSDEKLSTDEPVLRFQKQQDQKIVKDLKSLIQYSNIEVINQQNEIDQLQAQIESLENQLIHKRELLNTNADECTKLNKLHNNFLRKYKETNSKIDLLKTKYQELENKFSTNLKLLESTSKEKNETINELENQLYVLENKV